MSKPTKTQQMIGMKFGAVEVIGTSRQGREREYAQCMCSCGRIFYTRRQSLLYGTTTACDPCGRKKKRTHGMRGSREYSIWTYMKYRCKTGRGGYDGIEVCSEWKESFGNFIRDMGRAPSDSHSIDRIDNEKGYCKQNCRWATVAEQNRNQRRNLILTHKGSRYCAAEFARLLGVHESTVGRWIKRGLTPDQMEQKADRITS